jgi:hypothetical protein
VPHNAGYETDDLSTPVWTDVYNALECGTADVFERCLGGIAGSEECC